jgi:dihydrofolate reductase
MAKLIYTAICSLDGYVSDETGDFSWAAPDDEVHAFVNDLERPIGTYLCGRRLYEVMVFWERPDESVAASEVTRDYAGIWQAADKVVYSRTLAEPASARTRIERDFDPAAIRRLLTEADRDVSVGGAELAGTALRAGLVDEVRLFLHPVLVGGGTPALPTGVRLDLDLLDERRFGGGVVYLRHRTRR